MTTVTELDHGWVSLVDHMGTDEAVVANARQSYTADPRAEGRTAEQNQKLISYLMRNRHTSPFEAVTFTFGVSCPIFVARQWMRHRTWSYNEISARYTQLPDKFYLPKPEQVGVQHASNKQMRTVDGEPTTAAEEFVLRLGAHSNYAYQEYQRALDAGIPRELARCFLPLNTYTQFSGTVNLHNLFHFLRLRLHEHAQYEVRVYAQAIVELIYPIVPMCTEAFLQSLRADKKE